MQTATNPQTGERVQFDEASNQWIPMETERRQAIAGSQGIDTFPVPSPLSDGMRQEIDGQAQQRIGIENAVATRQGQQPQQAPIVPREAQGLRGRMTPESAARVGGLGSRPADPEAEQREAALAAMPPERRAMLESITAAEAALIGAGRGLTTIGRAVGLADPDDPFARQALKNLETARPTATMVGEIAGESAPFLVPGLGVAALPGRAAQVAGAVGLGALESGAITRGRGEDIGTQAQAAGLGGLLAGGLDVALPILGRLGGKVVRRVLGKAPDGVVIDAAGKPSQELLDALAQTGQTFDDIVKEASDELAGQAVSPRQAARKAFLKSQGVDPTKAQITRNAADFQAQQEAAKTSSMVRDALERQEAVLTTRFDDAVLKTGGNSSAPSSTVVDALTEKATVLDQEIGDLYKAAREAAPNAKNIRFNGLTNKLRRLEGADRRAGGNISAMINDMQSKGILNDSKKVIGSVGVETAEDLRKLANELYDPANPFGNMLLRQVKDELDDDVFKAAGKDFFKQARKSKASFEKGLARAKISKFDSRKNNLVRDILENKVDPDQMVDKVVFGKSWRPDDLKQLKDYISTDEVGKKAFNDMRAEVMEKIKEKAFIGPVDEAGFQALSRDKLQKAIGSIGDKKLSILFTAKENKFLRDMLNVSKLREPVRGTAIGRGPSAQAIGRIESAIRSNPVVRALLDSVSLDAQGRAVLKAKPSSIAAKAVTIPAGVRALEAPAAAAIISQQGDTP